MRVLGIESSCDETGVALYDTSRPGVDGLLAHAVYSQIKLHAEYGGVVPELASRDHVRKLLPLIRQTLAEAGLSVRDIDGVAYTAVDWQRPAVLLIGSEAQGAGAQAERLATGRVTIPMRDATESLNAAMATGILLFEAARQRGEEKSSRPGAKEAKSAKSKH